MTEAAPRRSGRTVRGVLATRMVLAAAVAAAVVAAFAIVTERKALGEVATERAQMGVVALMALIDSEDSPRGKLDEAHVQAGLEHLKDQAAVQSLDAGRFIAAAVYDAAGKRIGEIRNDTALAEIGGPPLIPAARADEGSRFEYSRPNGVPIVSLTVPVLRAGGAFAGRVDAVFAVSEEAFAGGISRIVRRVLIAVGTVFVSALVIYPLIARLVSRLGRAGRQLLEGNLESIAALGSAIAKKDSDTDVHNYRVTIYAARLGEAAGLDRKALCALMKGAFLHDVGKIGIRDAILLKPGRLEEDEFTEMKKHVQYGLEIVRQSSWLKDAADVVGSHHERFDGTGYLQGLRGEDIPINARVFAIADVFDALTSRRPYKEPMPYEEAMKIVKLGRGTHFDPRLLALFIAISRSLYDEFGNRDDDGPRAALAALIDRYFKTDDELLLT